VVGGAPARVYHVHVVDTVVAEHLTSDIRTRHITTDDDFRILLHPAVEKCRDKPAYEGCTDE